MSQNLHLKNEVQKFKETDTSQHISEVAVIIHKKIKHLMCSEDTVLPKKTGYEI